MGNIFYDVDDLDKWRYANPRQLSKEQAKQLQRELGVEEDGIVGKKTITALQRRLGVDADGVWGKKSQAAYVEEYNDEAIERDRHNAAKAQGKVNPAVVDLFAKEEPATVVNTYEVRDSKELAQLNAEIEKVRSMIAERKTEYEGVPQPKTQVGWSSYIVNNDRGMLDKYQDAERQWYNLRKQERHAKELAEAQHDSQRAINLNDARDTLAKLQIMKDNAQQQGNDTRDIDVQINSVYRDYPELKNNTAVSEPYDPRKSIEYVLADVEDIDDNNTQEEIKEAIERVSKYNTPNSIKALNRLDKALTRRIRKEESQGKYYSEVNNWINGGDTSTYLYNLGLETQFAGDKERLVNKKTGKVVAERPRNNAPTKPSNTNNNYWEV